MPPIDAATLARLRARYAPEPWQGACPFCRGATTVAMADLWEGGILCESRQMRKFRSG